GFTLCARCRDEYESPASRRFHAEPNACPECGPRLTWREDGADAQTGDDALRRAVERIAAGAIVAIKALGGFLLAADAGNEDTIARLRARKHRPDKPFAVMARDLAVVERIAVLAPEARRV